MLSSSPSDSKDTASSKTSEANKKVVITTQQVVNEIMNYIKDERLEGVVMSLSRLPLGTYALSTATHIANILLMGCTRVADHECGTEAARMIIQTFDIARIKVDPLPFLVQLLFDERIKRRELTFALRSFPEKTGYDIFVDLLNTSGHNAGFPIGIQADDIALVANIIYVEYPGITLDEWKSLRKLSMPPEDDEEDYSTGTMIILRGIFDQFIAEHSKRDNPPSWVRKYPEFPLPEYPSEVLSVADAVHLMNAMFSGDKIVFMKDGKPSKGDEDDSIPDDQAERVLISQYAMSTVIEREAQLHGLVKYPEYLEQIVFREHGPLNSNYHAHHCNDTCNHPETLKTICDSYGGCRMLSCNCITEKSVDDDLMSANQDVVDWFTGECQVCECKIYRRHYAVRMPCDRGSWRGCYCSYHCLTSGIYKDMVDPDTEETLEYCTDPGKEFVLDRMFDQLELIGIRQRE